MTSSAEEIDDLLAAALRGEPHWTRRVTASDILERIDYHGVAGLLAERTDELCDWPSAIIGAIRERALSQSMWELRHRLIVGQLLDRMATGGVAAVLLKGTAVAYDVYDNPAARRRGDTDLLVASDSRASARKVLEDCDFRRDVDEQDVPEALRSQEGWTCNSQDGTSHSIDLHWQPLNAPALGRILKFEEMATQTRHLSGLCEAALAPSRPLLLFHACLHRGLHNCSPYFVGGRTYFGSNRLIWLYDLVLLGKALSNAEWGHFSRIAVGKRMADVCLEGLAAAESRFGPFVPAIVRDELGAAPAGLYFRSGQFGRAILDTWAVPGVARKGLYVWARSLPSARFIRAKYTDMADRPLAALYLRRFAELLQERPRNGRADRA